MNHLLSPWGWVNYSMCLHASSLPDQETKLNFIYHHQKLGMEGRYVIMTKSLKSLNIHLRPLLLLKLHSLYHIILNMRDEKKSNIDVFQIKIWKEFDKIHFNF